MDLLLMNELVNAAREEAESLGLPLKQAPPEVAVEFGYVVVRFPVRGGRVSVRVSGRGEAYGARYERSLFRRLLRP